MGKIFNKKILIFFIFMLIITLSIGYAAFDSHLVFENITANIRTDVDIRVTGVSIEKGTEGVQAEGENYYESGIVTKVSLPKKDSSITYRVKITNFGSTEMGIFEIVGLPEYLDYSISNYNLKDKICDNSNKCSFGIIKDDILLTIKYKDGQDMPSIINHNINIKFDFREIYSITYKGITNKDYPTEIISGGNLEIDFSNSNLYNVVPYINNNKLDYDKYVYENNILKINNITGNVTVEYKSKVYLAVLAKNKFFKESAHLTKIQTIQFVNYVAVPSDRIAQYDLSLNVDGSIIGWIDKSYNLYIGSDWHIYSQNLFNAFLDMSGVTSIKFDNLNTSETINMTSMFNGCSNLAEIDVSTFNTSNVEYMDGMFKNMVSIKKLDLRNFDTRNVIQMTEMFSGMSSLRTIDLSSFDTSKVTTMYWMFQGCKELTSLDVSNFNTSKVKNMVRMFHGCLNLITLDLSMFDTSNVETIESMFGNDKKLTSLNVSNWNTSNVKNMRNVFSACENLASIDLSKWDTSNVTTMTSMFYSCISLTNLDLSSFDTSAVTDMNFMFVNNYSLVSVDLSNFDTKNVVDMQAMFSDCRSLKELDLSNFEIPKVTNTSYMFYNTWAIEKINFSNADFSKVTNYENMFYNALSTVNLTVKDDIQKNWITSNFNQLTNVTVIS